MNLTFTANRLGDNIKLYVDRFDIDPDAKFCYTGGPVPFTRRATFTQDTGEPVFELSLDEARDLIKELLRSTIGDE